MAARSGKSARTQAQTVRRSSAALCVVLAFAAGLLFGSLATHFTAQPLSPAEHNTSGPGSDKQEHIRSIEQLTKDQPDNAAAWIHLGDAWYDAGEPARAISAYERGLSLNPDNPDAQTDLGTAYRLVGKFEQAVAHYNEALTRNPRHINARLNKGIVLYYDLGRKQEALEAWNNLLRIAPDVKAPDGTPLREFVARHSAK